MKKLRLSIISILFISMLLFKSKACWSKEYDTVKVAEGYKNKISLSAGGHGFLYTLNYERLLSQRTNFRPFLQAGFALYPTKKGPITSLWLPVSLNLDIRFNNMLWLELGLGHVIAIWDQVFFDAAMITSRIAIRIQKLSLRSFMKFEFLPMALYNPKINISPWGAITVGLSF